MNGSLRRASEVLDLFTAQVLTIAARLGVVQLSVPGCITRVIDYGSVPHAAQAPQFMREVCKEEK